METKLDIILCCQKNMFIIWIRSIWTLMRWIRMFCCMDKKFCAKYTFTVKVKYLKRCEMVDEKNDWTTWRIYCVFSVILCNPPKFQHNTRCNALPFFSIQFHISFAVTSKQITHNKLSAILSGLATILSRHVFTRCTSH